VEKNAAATQNSQRKTAQNKKATQNTSKHVEIRKQKHHIKTKNNQTQQF
jgi:hypothetical protein